MSGRVAQRASPRSRVQRTAAAPGAAIGRRGPLRRHRLRTGSCASPPTSPATSPTACRSPGCSTAPSGSSASTCVPPTTRLYAVTNAQPRLHGQPRHRRHASRRSTRSARRSTARSSASTSTPSPTRCASSATPTRTCASGSPTARRSTTARSTTADGANPVGHRLRLHQQRPGRDRARRSSTSTSAATRSCARTRRTPAR